MMVKITFKAVGLFTDPPPVRGKKRATDKGLCVHFFESPVTIIATVTQLGKYIKVLELFFVA